MNFFLQIGLFASKIGRKPLAGPLGHLLDSLKARKRAGTVHGQSAHRDERLLCHSGSRLDLPLHLSTLERFHSKVIIIEPASIRRSATTEIRFNTTPAYKKAVKISPSYARAHNNLTVAYILKGEYGPAIRHCDRALELGHKVTPAILEKLKPHRE